MRLVSLSFPKTDFLFPIPKSWLCYSWENSQPLMMGISYILPISLGEYLTSCDGDFLYLPKMLPSSSTSSLVGYQG
jgi:hypothetical protein